MAARPLKGASHGREQGKGVSLQASQGPRGSFFLMDGPCLGGSQIRCKEQSKLSMLFTKSACDESPIVQCARTDTESQSAACLCLCLSGLC